MNQYTAPTWANGTTPAIDAAAMQAISNALVNEDITNPASPATAVLAAKSGFQRAATSLAPSPFQIATDIPTVTWNLGSDGAQIAGALSYSQLSTRWTYPGTVTKVVSNYIQDTTAGNGSPTGLTVEFHHTGPKVTFVLRATSNSGELYRISVNGQPITDRAQSPSVAMSAGGTFRVTLTFSSTASRRITFDAYLFNLLNIEVGPADSINPAPRAKRRIGIISDSFAGGGNGASDGVGPLETFPWHIQKILGCEVFNGGQGGSGYANNGKGNVSGNEVFGHSSRLDPMIGAGLDELWFWGSVNDANSTNVAGVQTAALAAFQYVAQNAPALPIYVFGVQPSTPPNQANGAYIASARSQIMAAAAASPNVKGIADLIGDGGTWPPDFAASTAYSVGQKVVYQGAIWVILVAHTSGISMNRGYAEPITVFTGDGWTTNLKADGNRDIMLSSDSVHPTFLGHRELAVATVNAYLNMHIK